MLAKEKRCRAHALGFIIATILAGWYLMVLATPVQRNPSLSVGVGSPAQLRHRARMPSEKRERKNLVLGSHRCQAGFSRDGIWRFVWLRMVEERGRTMFISLMAILLAPIAWGFDVGVWVQATRIRDY
jgi:hypothetical protein